jgi:hypothetical protein
LIFSRVAPASTLGAGSARVRFASSEIVTNLRRIRDDPRCNYKRGFLPSRTMGTSRPSAAGRNFCEDCARSSVVPSDRPCH